MREYIQAVKAILHSWQTEEPLTFEGTYYTHNLMPPFFRPPVNPHGAPKIMLAAVGGGMCRVAAEVADGMIFHTFSTPGYVDTTLSGALRDSGRDRELVERPFEVAGSVFIVTGRDDEEMARADLAVRKKIAFYGTTPSYAPVFEHSGWEDLHEELRRLAAAKRWDDMHLAVDDAHLEGIAVVAAPEDVGVRVRERFAGIADRLTLDTPYDLSAEARASMLSGVFAGARVEDVG
jgi:probable F420-dependent oxidoreductase